MRDHICATSNIEDKTRKRKGLPRTASGSFTEFDDRLGDRKARHCAGASDAAGRTRGLRHCDRDLLRLGTAFLMTEVLSYHGIHVICVGSSPTLARNPVRMIVRHMFTRVHRQSQMQSLFDLPDTPLARAIIGLPTNDNDPQMRAVSRVSNAKRWNYPSNAWKTHTAFWPPKPKPSEMARRTSRFFATSGV